MKETIEEMLIRHEGLRLKPYRCTAGKLTIGVGRNLEDVGITRGEAICLLKNDIKACQYQLNIFLPWWKNLNEERKSVLIDMCFNLGIKGLLNFKKTLSLIEHGQYEDAAIEMLNSQWAKQVGSRAIELSQIIAGKNETETT